LNSYNQSTGNIKSASNQTKKEGWAGLHHLFYQGQDMEDWILLDNESTTTIFCNPDMIQDICNIKNKSLDLVTNAGILRTTQKATIPGWGEAWFNPQAITNIFSYAKMAKRHRITYNSNKEDAFTVYLPDKRIKFTKTDQGLYVFKPKIRKTNRIGSQFVNTVDENKTFFTTRQVDKAKQAREHCHALGTPPIQDFKAILCMNLIANNPVTTEDIEIAEEIFGPDIGSLKSKTTRRKPVPVVKDYIKIPPELTIKQQDVTLCIDSMKVNGLSFLTTIQKHLLSNSSIHCKQIDNLIQGSIERSDPGLQQGWIQDHQNQG
jgi:hypothetical protein